MTAPHRQAGTTALDQDVDIVIKTKQRSRTAGRISVIAA